MAFELPPVVKSIEGLLRDIEQAVGRFPRRHRYVIGLDLRHQTMNLARLAHRAWRDRPNAAEWIRKLVWAVDDYKLTLQLAKNVQAFGSFGEFEAIARTTAEIGRQVGGWSKVKHPQGQSAPARGPAQRPTTLSTRAASRGANA